MAPVTLVNGNQDQRLEVQDRGLSYGDGVFETIALRQGQVQLWSAHGQRLIKGLQSLGMVTNTKAATQLVSHLIADIQAAYSLCAHADGVIKITVTRGLGERGYLAPQEPLCTRIVSLSPWPQGRAALSATGVNARVCRHAWSTNPALAGLKHLNRLDQVLARNEWHDESVHEGIMLDQNGGVISGVMSNLFVEIQGRLLVPKLDQCGIAGVMAAQVRQLAVDLGIEVQQQAVCIADLARADAVFLTNSLNGIWPLVCLQRLDSSQLLRWPVSPITSKLQQALAKLLAQQPKVGDLC